MGDLPPKDPGEKCNGRNKAHTKYCGKAAGWGTSHVGVGRCKLHGGAEQHAELNGMVELARREAVVMGQPLPIDPAEAILECIRIAAGEVRYASERIAALTEDEAVGPVVTTLERPLKYEKGADAPNHTVTETTHGPPAVHIWIEVRQRAMDRLVSFSATAIKAGVEERRVQLAEQQGQALAEAIRRILQALGVADRPEVPSIVRRELTLIAGAA